VNRNGTKDKKIGEGIRSWNVIRIRNIGGIGNDQR